jgi:hypothetical protein
MSAFPVKIITYIDVGEVEIERLTLEAVVTYDPCLLAAPVASEKQKSRSVKAPIGMSYVTERRTANE